MQNFHAVMIDETGCEFSVGLRANTHEDARDQLRVDYPESALVQIENDADTCAREAALWARMWDEQDDQH